MNGARLSVLIFLAFLLPQVAQAAPFGYRYSGAVTSITEYTPGILGSSVQVGDTVSGRVFFNAVSATPTFEAYGSLGFIQQGFETHGSGAPGWRSFQFETNVGSFRLASTEGFVARTDSFQTTSGSPSFIARDRLSIGTQFGNLFGPPADALSTNLPTAPGILPEIAALVELVSEGLPSLYGPFDINELEVDLRAADLATGYVESTGWQDGAETGYRIEFEIDLGSLRDASDISEPSAVALLIAGLAGIGFAARRRRKAA